MRGSAPTGCFPPLLGFISPLLLAVFWVCVFVFVIMRDESNRAANLRGMQSDTNRRTHHRRVRFIKHQDASHVKRDNKQRCHLGKFTSACTQHTGEPVRSESANALESSLHCCCCCCLATCQLASENRPPPQDRHPTDSTAPESRISASDQILKVKLSAHVRI